MKGFVGLSQHIEGGMFVLFLFLAVEEGKGDLLLLWGYGYTSHPPLLIIAPPLANHRTLLIAILLIIARPFTNHRTPGISDALSA
jgi:hypothetical protein